MAAEDLHPSTHLRAAAWVPDDVEDRPWEEAVALAADWIWERSREEDLAPLLVSNRVLKMLRARQDYEDDTLS